MCVCVCEFVCVFVCVSLCVCLCVITNKLSVYQDFKFAVLGLLVIYVNMFQLGVCSW